MAEQELITPLNKAETKKLAELQERILRADEAKGVALIIIHEEQLYREHGTFSAYCRKVLEMSKQHVHRLIESAKVLQDLSTLDIPPPTNERQARELVDLDSEQDRATVWSKAVETAPKDKDGAPKVTAAIVKKVKRDIIGGNGKVDPKKITPAPAPDIPKAAAEGLAHKSDFDRWVRTLNALAKEVEAATEQPWGVMLPLSEIQIDVKDLRSAIKFGKPDDVCPRCKGKRCALCSKRGWVTREQKAGMV